MDLRLLVLRTKNIQKLADFYSNLGLIFEYHQHGNGPMHYAAKIDKTILEIYPLAKGQTETDKYLRIGFGIDDFENVIGKLKTLEIQFQQEPTDTPFGIMAVIIDADGRKVELYKK